MCDGMCWRGAVVRTTLCMMKRELDVSCEGVTNQLKFFNNGMPLLARALSPLPMCLRLFVICRLLGIYVHFCLRQSFSASSFDALFSPPLDCQSFLLIFCRLSSFARTIAKHFAPASSPPASSPREDALASDMPLCRVQTRRLSSSASWAKL